MGQAYLIANLDKGEFLHPHRFGQGQKLCEFGCGPGILTALALLCSNGNGRGGGDLCRTVESTEPEAPGLNPGERIDCSFNYTDGAGARVYRSIVVPEIAGSWASDRIIVAGDYGDHGRFLSDDQIAQFQRDAPEVLRRKYLSPRAIRMCYAGDRAKGEALYQERLERVNAGDFTLFDYAEIYFTDVSEAAFQAICINPSIRKAAVELFATGKAFCADKPPKFLRRAVAKRRAKLRREGESKAAVVPVTFVSEWDGGTSIQTPAKFDRSTGRIFDIETEDSPEDQALVREWIILPTGGEIEVCRQCHEYVLRPAEQGQEGKPVAEVCSDPSCESNTPL